LEFTPAADAATLRASPWSQQLPMAMPWGPNAPERTSDDPDPDDLVCQ
jgi:hypothetical protein